MNVQISRLSRIASRETRSIIGLMSGTSLDGLDVALCKIRGHGFRTKLTLAHFETVAYKSEVKERIREVFAKKQVDFVRLSTLHPWIGMLHGDMVLSCLRKWRTKSSEVDLIASHGQTVMHAPAFLHPGDPIHSTFQAGDGDHLAVRTGIITVSDFRQKHIAAGGEGAPLAVYGDYLLLSDRKENRILLNMGGIGNFTFLPAGRDAAKVFVTDTGPGNTLIDQAMIHYTGKSFDKDAAMASRGTFHAGLLNALKSNEFFKLPFPKTTGPELFNLDYVNQAQRLSNAEHLSVEDLLATLTRFTAETIAEAIQRSTGNRKFAIYVSGGGAHNPLVIRWLKQLLKTEVMPPTDVLGVPGDAKEAVLFALLANEAVAGKRIDFGRRSRIPSVTMGKISFPT